MHRRPWLTIASIWLLLVLAAPPAAQAGKGSASELPPTRQEITVVGFSSSGKEVILRINDENIGTLFQARSIKKGTILASFPFTEADEKRAWRKVSKAHKVSDAFSDAPENPKKKVVMMSQVKGDKIRILMMRGEAIKHYLDIPLHTNKKGEPADAFVKQMVWDHKGKHGVVVYHQATKGRMTWEGDFIHSFKFKLYRTGFDSDTAK